jgi:FMN phosphatase YigB (HAD superfamily)
MPESFDIAMKAAGETDPSRCVMIDDLTRTTRAAKSAGMFSILFGETATNEEANASFSDWKDLTNILESSS